MKNAFRSRSRENVCMSERERDIDESMNSTREALLHCLYKIVV
jgi:hypothetical protein